MVPKLAAEAQHLLDQLPARPPRRAGSVEGARTGLRAAAAAVFGPIVRTTLPALVMAAVVLAVPQLHVLVRIAMGAAVYVGGAWLTRGWRMSDIRRLSRV